MKNKIFSLTLILILLLSGIGLFYFNEQNYLLNSNSQNSLYDENLVGHISQVEMQEYGETIIVTDDEENQQIYSWGRNKYNSLLMVDDESATENSVDILYDSPSKSPYDFHYPIKQISSYGGFSGIIFFYDYHTSASYYSLDSVGYNEYGQLGIGLYNNYLTPITSLIYHNIDQISYGQYFSTAITTDENGKDHLFTWGSDLKQELGNGGDENSSGEEVIEPKEITISDDVEQINYIFAGISCAGVITTNIDGYDHLYTWGSNDQGKLGLGEINSNYVSTPQEVTFDQNVKSIEKISFGSNNSMAVTTDFDDNYHLYTWGSNEYGQLGLGDTYSDEYYSTPQEVNLNFLGDNFIIKDIASAKESNAMIVTDNEGIDHLYTWGLNNQGQLGLGDNYSNEYYSTPQEVDINQDNIYGDEGKIQQINSDPNIDTFSVVLNDGKKDIIYNWGSNNNSLLGIGKDFNELEYSNVPVSVFSSINSYNGSILIDNVEVSNIGNDYAIIEYDLSTSENIKSMGGPIIESIKIEGFNDEVQGESEIVYSNELHGQIKISNLNWDTWYDNLKLVVTYDGSSGLFSTTEMDIGKFKTSGSEPAVYPGEEYNNGEENSNLWKIILLIFIVLLIIVIWIIVTIYLVIK